MAEIEDVDWSYYGCFVECEGSFTATVTNVAAGARVSASNTFKPILDKLQFRFGGGITEKKKTQTWSKKQVYTWQLSKASEIIAFITGILPYLRIKKQQALLVLTLAQHIAAGTSGTPLDDKETLFRLTIVEKVALLNKGEVN